jgi:hypothetical protein
MSEDRDFLDRVFYFLGKLFAFIKTPFGIYLTLIVLIILFPPIDAHYGYKVDFYGWFFIMVLGGNLKINIIYFLGEIGIVTLVYFIYLQSKKK